MPSISWPSQASHHLPWAASPLWRSKHFIYTKKLKKAPLFFPLYSKDSHGIIEKNSMPEVSQAHRLNLHLSVPGPLFVLWCPSPAQRAGQEGRLDPITEQTPSVNFLLVFKTSETFYTWKLATFAPLLFSLSINFRPVCLMPFLNCAVLKQSPACLTTAITSI